MATTAPLFARQPIFDRSLTVVAYELLFRGGLDSVRAQVDGDEATSQVLLYAFGQHQIEEITGQVPAYINFTRHWLMFPPSLPPQQLVVEVLEDVPADEQVLNGLKLLREKGYRIALDDFLINRESKAFLAFADIVKIDVLALNDDQLGSYVAQLRPFGVKLLAEKIESLDMFKRCQTLGFDYFQGYFLSRPYLLEGAAIGELKEELLQQLMVFTSASSDVELILERIKADKELSRRLIHVAAALDGGAESSLATVVRRLGRVRLGAWAAFITLASYTGKPTALTGQGLARARFCELVIADEGDSASKDTAFATGLLSMLDAFLDLPMDYVVANLDLDVSYKQALLEHSGDAGCALDLIINLESADWPGLSRSPWCHTQKLSDYQIAEAYGEALLWSQRMVALIN